MRPTTEKFKINGVPMLAPDADVGISYEDLDTAEAGRDESGIMHRFPVRYKVGSWTFSYSHLTEEERQYMEQLFPAAPTFQFTHPGRLLTDTPEVSTCYRSKYAISWKNARTGLWSNYGFTVIQC